MPRIDRNARARLMFHAEALDRRTHRPGQHGGMLKRSGLQVLRTLLFSFANVITGRCDPSYNTLARVAGVARSTVALALKRLEAAGLLERVRRQIGLRRFTNAYVFRKSENRPQTTNNPKTPESKRCANPFVPASLTPTEARAQLQADYQRLLAARAARQARQAAMTATVS